MESNIIDRVLHNNYIYWASNDNMILYNFSFVLMSIVYTKMLLIWDQEC